MMETLNNLGVAAQERGDADEAAGHFHQTLQLGRELGNTLGVAICLYNLGDVVQMRQTRASKRQAVRFFAAAEYLFQTLKSRYANAASEMLVCLMQDLTLGYSETVLAAIRSATCDKSLDELVYWSLEETEESTV